MHSFLILSRYSSLTIASDVSLVPTIILERTKESKKEKRSEKREKRRENTCIKRNKKRERERCTVEEVHFDDPEGPSPYKFYARLPQIILLTFLSLPTVISTCTIINHHYY